MKQAETITQMYQKSIPILQERTFISQNLKKRLIKKLQKLEEYISAYQENKDILISFIEKYIECEICYKALLLAYRTEKKQDIKESSLKINLTEVKKIMVYFNYNIDENTLKYLFSSNEKKNEMSAKKIRDNILHKLSEKAISEVIERFNELDNYMNKFLGLFSETN